EEVLPDAGLIPILEEFNRDHAGTARARFANPGDIAAAFRPAVEEAIAGGGPFPVQDLNPAMPGCYVTHIALKQRTRAIAYRLCAAEAALADAAWSAGAPAAMPAELTDAWRKVCFNQFHDAITGTHIDQACDELVEMLDAAEAAADRHAPPARPAAEAPADDAFAPVEDGLQTLALGPYEIAYDREGVRSILVDGEDLFGRLAPFHKASRPPCIGELHLDTDFGDAWGQRIEPFTGIRHNVHLIPLGRYHERVTSAGTALRWHGVYTGPDPHVERLAWTTTLSLGEDGRLLVFRTDVDWDTRSRRLRVLTPVNSEDATATYEVPYGFIERTYDEAKLDYSQWDSHTMEWPALHWVHKEIDEARGVALFNRGLPCCRWTPGRLDLSLLRSPEWGFCIVEPCNYEFWDIDGQRDTGTHRFEYALLPHTRPAPYGDLTRLGYAFNDAALQPPCSVEGDVVVTAWKPAEDGAGWVLRVQEAGGAGTDLALGFDRAVRATRCDLLERPDGDPVEGERVEAHLHRHQIATWRIERPA
ncbi:MAG: glycoside hydrolase family 38 C-terminal domain-containing protein, partial [Planctomycetota bacterium]